MQHRSLIALAFLTAATLTSAQTPASSGAEFYAEASAILAYLGDFDAGSGGAVAVGVTLGSVHSLEVEAIRFKSTRGETDTTFTPVLATYKYGIPLTPKLTLQVGASAGSTKQHWREFMNVPLLPGRWVEYNERSFTYGASAGVSYALAEHISLDATVKALRMEQPYNLSERTNIVSVGLNFHF